MLVELEKIIEGLDYISKNNMAKAKAYSFESKTASTEALQEHYNDISNTYYIKYKEDESIIEKLQLMLHDLKAHFPSEDEMRDLLRKEDENE